jgi:hypothetical protein
MVPSPFVVTWCAVSRRVAPAIRLPGVLWRARLVLPICIEAVFISGKSFKQKLNPEKTER